MYTDDRPDTVEELREPLVQGDLTIQARTNTATSAALKTMNSIKGSLRIKTGLEKVKRSWSRSKQAMLKPAKAAQEMFSRSGGYETIGSDQGKATEGSRKQPLK
jgi:hypothetical protein